MYNEKLTELKYSPREKVLMKIGNFNHTCNKAPIDKDYPISEYIRGAKDPNNPEGQSIHEHLTTLYMLTIQLKLKRIVELGCGDDAGDSTIGLLLAAQKINGTLSSFDIQPAKHLINRVKKLDLSKYWTFTQIDDLKVNWNSPIDHLYIDTDHYYTQTIRELEKYEPYVIGGGIITMHDSVVCPDVKRAAKDYFKQRKDISIYEYVNNNGLIVIFKS